MIKKSFSAKIDKTKWDFRAIKEKSAQIIATGEIKNSISEEIERQISLIKQWMINQIHSHKVTQEIEAGSRDPAANINLSGCCGGYGNLWEFIGFSDDDDPIGDVIAPIQYHRPVITVRPYKDVVRVTATFPVKEDVYDNTPMPWADGRSWAQGIALGIAGFGRFLSTDEGYSESGGGFQVDHDNLSSKGNRPNKFTRTSYIAPIFAQALADFNKSIKQNFKVTKR